MSTRYVNEIICRWCEVQSDANEMFGAKVSSREKVDDDKRERAKPRVMGSSTADKVARRADHGVEAVNSPTRGVRCPKSSIHSTWFVWFLSSSLNQVREFINIRHIFMWSA